MRNPESIIPSPDSHESVAPDDASDTAESQEIEDRGSGSPEQNIIDFESESRELRNENLPEITFIATELILQAKERIDAYPDLDIETLKQELLTTLDKHFDAQEPSEQVEILRRYFQTKIDSFLQVYEKTRKEIEKYKAMGGEGIVAEVFNGFKPKKRVIVEESPYGLMILMDFQDMQEAFGATQGPDSKAVEINTKGKFAGLHIRGRPLLFLPQTTLRSRLNIFGNSERMNTSHETIHSFNDILIEAKQVDMLKSLREIVAVISDPDLPIADKRKKVDECSMLFMDGIKDEILAYYNQENTGLLGLVIKAGKKAGVGKQVMVERLLSSYVDYYIGHLDTLKDKAVDPEIQDLLERRKTIIRKITDKATNTYGDLSEQLDEVDGKDSAKLQEQLFVAGAVTPMYRYRDSLPRVAGYAMKAVEKADGQASAA